MPDVRASPAASCCARLLRNDSTPPPRSRGCAGADAGGVDLSDLTPARANTLAQRVAPMLGYMVRLTDRMQKRGRRANVYRGGVGPKANC